MTDLLLRIGISNLCVSLVFAALACVVQMTGKRPFVAHLLWLLVLVKLLTPPILTIPVLAIPVSPAITVVGALDQDDQDDRAAAAVQDSLWTSEAQLLTTTWSSAVENVKTWFVLICLLGSACVLAWSLLRIYRFDRLLRMASEIAPPELQRVASQIAKRLGLVVTPTIYTTSAHLSPMLWWIGGRVRIFIPVDLLRELEAGQLRLILAHELAHARRRDHLVRWLEWLACVVFWWNPVAWWARRNLRAHEEVCCDALVLESLKPDPRTYANALLSVVEYLAPAALRPPAMASEINSGGFLERRFKMIVSSNPIRKTPRWLHAFILLFAVGLLPLGVAHAQDPDYDAVGKRLKAAVKAGELSGEQARAMFGTLEKTGGARKARGSKKDQGWAKAKAYLAQVKKELGAAISAGKLSKQAAAIRYKGAEKAVKARFAGGRNDKKSKAKKGQQPDWARAHMLKLKKELGAAVRAGKLSRDDAVKKYRGIEKEVKQKIAAIRRNDRRAGSKKASDSDRATAYLFDVMKKLDVAVMSGEMTRRQAGAKIAAVRKSLEKRKAKGRRQRGAKRITREDYARAAVELRKAVAERRISRRDARARLAGMRKAMGDQRGRRSRRDNDRRGADEHGQRRRRPQRRRNAREHRGNEHDRNEHRRNEHDRRDNEYEHRSNDRKRRDNERRRRAPVRRKKAV